MERIDLASNIWNFAKNTEDGFIYADPIEGNPDFSLIFLHGEKSDATTMF